MTLLIERAHALREAAIAMASAPDTVSSTPGSVLEPTSSTAAQAVVSAPSAPIRVPEVPARRPIAPSLRQSPLKARQEGVAPAPKPTYLLPVSAGMAIGGAMYIALPRVWPDRFEKNNEQAQSRRLWISIITAVAVAWVATRVA